MWTMDELIERVRLALAAEYPGAPNGRVRDVPDRRAIRWYTSIGLVDRPLGVRGRNALYGPRHLQQLVAIKRRQADGHSLANIQAEFVFFSDQALSEAARIPSDVLASDDTVQQGHDDSRQLRFWAHQPAREPPQEPSPSAAPAGRPVAEADTPVRPVHGVALPGGVILLVPHPLADRDRADIAAAAEPLLDLLNSRGLTDRSSS
jgi:MerR-like DNA binding protein